MSPSDADMVMLKLDAVKGELSREIKDLKLEVAEVKGHQGGTETRLRAAETWIARGQGAVGLLTFLAGSGIVALLIQHA